MNKKYKQLEKLYKNNLRCAEFFGMEYCEDVEWWYERIGKAWNFKYRDEDWELLKWKKILQYIDDLVIPPAWKNTFISPNPKSHILAQWEDNKGRKQYLYHEKWTDARRLINSYTLILFGEVLWEIRTAYKKLLKSDKNSYEFCLWVALLLLDKTVIRIGNKHYFDENGTIGISTLRCENVVSKSSRLYLEFPWKSWKNHSIHIRDKKLKNALIDLCSGDKQFIFSYQQDGKIKVITPDSINNYLRKIGCDVITAKDFRSWHASIIIFNTFIAEIYPKVSEKKRKKIILNSFDKASEKLWNTRNMIKESYAHEDTVESVRDVTFRKYYNATKDSKKLINLSQNESDFLSFLKRLYNENQAFS